jgi:hypothetical protein
VKLTNEEKALIQVNEKAVDDIIVTIEAVKCFKDGDFLIAFYPRSKFDLDKKRQPVINSYGAIKKFQVIAVDKHGIPYMKELNKSGKPIGGLIPSMTYSSRHTHQTYEFEVDPDYTDAIILEDQENYNATSAIKEKSDTFNAISKHNKKIKINTYDIDNLINFLNQVKVGDILWRSNVTSWSVVEIKPLPPQIKFTGFHDKFMKVLTNKSTEKYVSFSDVRWCALYTDRPRSYRELKDPK